MILVACDPGLTGAFALYDTRMGALTIHDTPTVTREVNKSQRQVLDEEGIIDKLVGFQMLGATHFIIEQVQGIPRQSAPATFNFALSYGVPLTAARVLGYQIERVTPSIWKTKLRVPKDKKAARARASEILPTHKHLWPLVKHDGRAEAALLAVWAQRTFEGKKVR